MAPNDIVLTPETEEAAEALKQFFAFFDPFWQGVPRSAQAEVIECISTAFDQLVPKVDGRDEPQVGAGGDGSGEEDTSNSGDTSNRSRSAQDPIDPAELLTAVIKLDEHHGTEDMKGIVRLAYSLLWEGLVYARPKNSLTAVILTDEDAKTIIDVFFNDMVGTAMERARDLVENVELYNSSLIPGAAALDHRGTPECLRPLVSSMSALAKEDRKVTFKYLQYNCHLMQFLQYWEGMRQSLVDMDEEGVQIANYLQLPIPKRGQTYVSLAKRAPPYEIWDIEHEVRLLPPQCSHPTRLGTNLWACALLFCPNNKSGNRHNFHHGTAAEMVFDMIDSADSKRIIQKLAKALYKSLVSKVYNSEPLDVNAAAFKANFDPDMPALTALGLLALDEMQED